ncbi:hypothetical protein [Nostoc parmelioides]|uniref:hypothetical protein n=1 Tax=Nostoc parmelioides TaxID=1521621 RepID=UPI001A7E600F|nr:hypothetical protein [Nostoc parmelioides]
MRGQRGGINICYKFQHTLIILNQRAEQAELLLEQERQCAEQLAAYLRSLGVDPDNLPQS